VTPYSKENIKFDLPLSSRLWLFFLCGIRFSIELENHFRGKKEVRMVIEGFG
jgi:hypothetical protein